MKKIFLILTIVFSTLVVKADDAPALFMNNNTLQELKSLNDSLELSDDEDAFGKTYNKSNVKKNSVKSNKKVFNMDFHADVTSNDSIIEFNSSMKTSISKIDISNKINQVKSSLKKFLE